MLLFCLTSASAQWHARSCGVQEIEFASPEEFDCLWNKANTVVKVGKITCAVGAGLAVIGGMTILIADPCCSSGYTMVGALGMKAGIIITAISIPIWTTGATRLSKLRANPLYEDFKRTSLELSPVIGKNQYAGKAHLGIGLCYRF